MRSLIANYKGAHTFYLDQGFVISAFHFFQAILNSLFYANWPRRCPGPDEFS